MMDIKIGNTIIGTHSPCYIIAEAGVNHNGDINLALELIKKAKESGADCVKFQTFRADSIITPDAPKASYQLLVTDPKESQYEMLRKLELNFSAYKTLIEACKKSSIQFLSTPYNRTDADFLNELGVDAFKIASGQIIELAFLKHVARFKKPIIISSGMSTLGEVEEAIRTIRAAGNSDIVLLQCTTNYPSKIEDANIKTIRSMKKSLGVLTGYSDHIESHLACYAAVALGACVIEKHFTLDNSLPGPDHKASATPSSFANLVKGIRATEACLGSEQKYPTEHEKKNIVGMRRSIVVIKELPKGTVITEKDIDFKRPGAGLQPQLFDTVIGKKTRNDLKENHSLSFNDVEW